MKKVLKVLGIIIAILIVTLIIYYAVIHFDGFLNKDNPMTRSEVIELLEKGKEYPNYYYASESSWIFGSLNETKTETYKIIVSSLRLDLIVSELIRKSRNRAKEFIINERVFINHKNEIKLTKEVKEEDLITIRGKGRFKISRILGNTQKGKIILEIEKYA